MFASFLIVYLLLDEKKEEEGVVRRNWRMLKLVGQSAAVALRMCVQLSEYQADEWTNRLCTFFIEKRQTLRLYDEGENQKQCVGNLVAYWKSNRKATAIDNLVSYHTFLATGVGLA